MIPPSDLSEQGTAKETCPLFIPIDSLKHKVYVSVATGEAGEAIEAYDSGRYFTVTGKGKGEIGDGQPAVDWLVAKYLKPETKRPGQDTQPPQTAHAEQRPSPTPSTSNLSADEIMAKIRQSKQSYKFDGLMGGNWKPYGSQSEADLALCAVIAFRTQAPVVIDAIFRQSKLMRPKWDEPHRSDKATYGTMTIEEVLSGNRETYKPKQNSKSKRKTTASWLVTGKRKKGRKRWLS